MAKRVRETFQMDSPPANRSPLVDPGRHEHWYALQVRARSEQMLAQVLVDKNFECYVPCWEQRRAYCDRVIRVAVPVFPGYAFCRFHLGERFRLLETPGVCCIVGIGKTPQAIDDEVVFALKKAFSSDRKISPAAYLQAGETVRIRRGPMAGATGLLVRVKGGSRIVISIHLLQRSVSVEIDADVIEPVGAPTAAVWSGRELAGIAARGA